MTAAKRLSVGVLDFGLRPAGVEQGDAVRAIVERAELADRLGYACYWLGEHYEPAACYSNPAALVPVVAGMTERLRVGAAAHLLAAHRPERLAADYALYEGLFPGRIDCGVGAGAPDAVPPSFAVAPELTYADRFAMLARSVGGDASRGGATPPPLPPGARPRLWSMGAGGFALHLAVTFGTAYSHASWLATPSRSDMFRRTLSSWRDSAKEAPIVNVAVAGVCAPTRAEAERLAAQCPLPVRPDIVGEPARCADWLLRASGTFGVDEIVFLDLAVEMEHRLRTMELLAAEMMR